MNLSRSRSNEFQRNLQSSKASSLGFHNLIIRRSDPKFKVEINLPAFTFIHPSCIKLSAYLLAKFFLQLALRFFMISSFETMEGAIRHLPPSKRLKLRHQKEKEGKHLPQDPIPSKCLPAKKRIELQLPAFEILLPAKKRVWVPHPLRPLDDDSIEISGEGVADEEDDGVICAVCSSTDGDPVDPIVFCDGCDLMVHASCYGSPLIQAIPEGDWFCLRCEREGKDEGVDFDCCLCPVKGGAVKPTTDGGQWAHVLCALLVPEVFFRHPEGRDGIDCSCVPKERKEMKCYLCRSNHGCGIQCSQPNCELGFHVSCGLGEGLCIEYNEAKGGGIVAGFCKAHTLLWQKQAQTGKFKIVPRKKHLGKKKSKE